MVFMLFGLVIGAIAKLMMPGRDPGGFIVTMLIGVTGSLVGGFLGRVLGIYSDANRTGGWVMSILGAVVLLGIYRAVSGRSVAV
jgi:uncharacterized membrane protein YeaQ/YmgE (transglycosylase-associated protein family)